MRQRDHSAGGSPEWPAVRTVVKWVLTTDDWRWQSRGAGGGTSSAVLAPLDIISPNESHASAGISLSAKPKGPVGNSVSRKQGQQSSSSVLGAGRDIWPNQQCCANGSTFQQGKWQKESPGAQARCGSRRTYARVQVALVWHYLLRTWQVELSCSWISLKHAPG